MNGILNPQKAKRNNMDDLNEFPTDKDLEKAEDDGNFELIIEKMEKAHPDVDFQKQREIFHFFYLSGQLAAHERTFRESKRRYAAQKS